MKKIKTAQLKQLVEAAIFVADAPVSIQQLRDTVLSDFTVAERTLKTVINELTLDYQPRGIQLVKVASGYRFQSVDALSPWLSKLWQETAPKYSRAMMETLALIAYRQPITRGEIEQVRGVAVSSSIMKTLTEREWVKVVGHKEVPGRPALYATTSTFLDYFSLSSLSELPNSDAFDEMAKSIDSTSSLKVLNEAPSEVTDRATENKQIKSDTND
ncbi:condensin subunit ScpB [Alteromonas sp. 76-1]|jgi:segregation and condensation protein B|uniref:SMC-Scp complex subunit ScpB n=1 Tax=Alteromonas TaxID=226 RepID=UPI000FD1855C|nr:MULTISPECIES: SMC-Scp complex subunit ScpB [Alteromonas]MBO7923376.1 SMC-Scp complex subunit ScpB [Alteromonas sp. K632G]MCQ8847392.1 SMC-Scp complex subunit ScpB [Alteromonas stellipolaris]VEL96409.1 condensin subunit ScpB [Alteromonas sp. 76-1]|tara:strand:+ start:157 stop:801 length:645 start_codon:yes stop_codon:yes gene_type:complete